MQFEAEKTVRKVGDTLASGIHGKIHEVEQENSGVEAAHRTEIVAETAVRHYQHHKERSANKPFEKVSRLEQKAEAADRKLHFEKTVAENPEMKSSRANMNRHYQKQHIRKEYAAARKAGSRPPPPQQRQPAKRFGRKHRIRQRASSPRTRKPSFGLVQGWPVLCFCPQGSVRVPRCFLLPVPPLSPPLI